MTPVTSSARTLLGYLGAWLVVGAAMAGLLVLTGTASWASALAFALPVSVVYGLVAASAYYVCRSMPMPSRRLGQTVVVFGGASLACGLLWNALCHAWNQMAAALAAILGLGPRASSELLVISEQMAILLFVSGSSLYLLSLLAHDLLIALADVRQAQASAAEAQVQARNAELQVLRSQINPHFLFNSLNSISALTSIDATAARAMTLELAQFFRMTLALSEQGHIALSEEIALCEHYLAIEKLRFGAKLQTDLQISDPARAALIPPMLLQPCVENAIKHGIRDLTEGGTITICATTRDAWLHISILNPVDATPGSSTGNGTGLNNIRRRLESLYGHQARVSVTRSADTFALQLTLPLRILEQPA